MKNLHYIAALDTIRKSGGYLSPREKATLERALPLYRMECRIAALESLQRQNQKILDANLDVLSYAHVKARRNLEDFETQIAVLKKAREELAG